MTSVLQPLQARLAFADQVIARQAAVVRAARPSRMRALVAISTSLLRLPPSASPMISSETPAE